MKLFSYLSLRSRFLIAPIIGIILAILLYITSDAIIREHSAVLQRLSESNLPLITKISQSSLLLGNEYTQLTLLLLSEQKHQDEELVYLEGRKILNNLHEIEHKFLIGLGIDNSGSISTQQAEHLMKIKAAFNISKFNNSFIK